MTHFKASILLLAATMLLAACAAHEPRPTHAVDIRTISIPEYQEFLAVLSISLEKGEPRQLNEREMKQFREVHQQLDRMVARHESIDDLSADEQVRLFNLHARLESVVVGRDEDQVLCRRRHKVGTNFKVSECKTVAEWRYEQEWAQRHLRSIMYSDAGRPDDM